jgi:hypothetical protein
MPRGRPRGFTKYEIQDLPGVGPVALWWIPSDSINGRDHTFVPILTDVADIPLVSPHHWRYEYGAKEERFGADGLPEVAHRQRARVCTRMKEGGVQRRIDLRRHLLGVRPDQFVGFRTPFDADFRRMNLAVFDTKEELNASNLAVWGPGAPNRNKSLHLPKKKP